jgi:isopentenyl phosphate kinase
MNEIIFLKLGGSLITDKDQVDTPIIPKLKEISEDISNALRERPGLQLVLGHGSGSFGHIPARKYGTRDGVNTPEEWLGFAHVWERARALNQIVVENLTSFGIPIVTFSPFSFLTTDDHKIVDWNGANIQTCLSNGLVPLLYGDTVLDKKIGGTILSTEELFIHLARHIPPSKILLAGLEPGVWQNFPERKQIYSEINSHFMDSVTLDDFISTSPDVTGGMASKITTMLNLVRSNPSIEVQIFSGQTSGNIYSTLLGSTIGTKICAREREIL